MSEDAVSDPTGCSIATTRHGMKEWWLQVEADSGLRGWVLKERIRGDNYWSNRNFDDVCILD